MKKFKKLIAGLSAAAIAMTVGVSAFAAVEGKAKASYGNGYVVLDKTDDINTTNQWTVVIIKKDKQNATLADTDLLYINQGTGEETFWKGTVDAEGNITAGMGVKGGKLDDGDYIVRIGGETITDASKVIEIALTVGGGEVKYYYGDVNLSGGFPNITDALEIISYVLWDPSVFDDEDETRLALRFKLGNISEDRETNSSLNVTDALEIISYLLWDPSTLDDLLPTE